MGDRAKSFAGLAVAIALLSLGAIFPTGAQTRAVPSRITEAIDRARLTILRGNTSPLAQARFDRGPAPPSLPMQRMILVLQRSSQQEDALDTLLEQQQNAASPSYHHWLTPQQFGQQFGPSDQDIQAVTSWLESQGFEVDQVSNGRTVIEFSGTALEVQSAFHTTIHQYLVNGENHWANSSDPEIPTALTPVVAGIDTLYNFPRVPLYHLAVRPRGPIRMGGTKPPSAEYTFPNPCSATAQPFCNFALGPYDFGTIYNVLPLWNQAPAVDGTGQTIAIVGESDISTQDFADFRNYFGLPANHLNIVVDGPDPGTVPGDETESDLDVEWAGAVAKGATIDLVESESTEASLGVDLSAQYIVDNDLAPVLSESYGVCEFFLGTAGNRFYNQLWQQAAAEGITVIVSSGDSGSAGCDGNLGSSGPAKDGLSVNGIASTPYDVSMGGTDFNDANDPLTYWNLTNSAPSGSTGGVASVSVKGYIPEMTWNDTCTNQELFSIFGTSSAAETCNDSTITQQYPFLLDPAGGSGGRSRCTSSDGQNLSSCTTPYGKPAWQTALTPADGARDVPDLAMFASNGFNGSFYVICEADLLNTSGTISVSGGYASTSCDPTDSNTGIVGVGGTSVPTPAFAGIVALINQASNSRQGNANYVLYKLAAQSGNSCASAANPASTCVFYDIPSGSTIAMPCASASPNCTTATGNSYGVLYDGSSPAYNTAGGYDLATGLGSINAANLVSHWKSFALALKPSATTLTLTPPTGGSLTNLTHGQGVMFTTNVSAVAPATGTPSGTVALMAQVASGDQAIDSVTLNSGAGSGTTTSLPGGTYTLVGRYPGDDTFASSTSSGVSVTVKPEASKVQIAYETFDPNTGTVTNPNATSAVFGTPSLLRVNVTSAAGDACPNNAPGDRGCPTGSLTLTDSYNGGAAAALDGGSFPLNAQGYAEDQVVDLAGGTHVVAAGYAGDNSYDAPTPNPATQTVMITPAATTTSVSSNTYQTTVGTNVDLNASISANNIFSSKGPSGTVTFYSGTTSLATVSASGSVNNVSNQASANVSLPTVSLPHGQDSITAQYSGDPNYQASTSPATSVSVLWVTMTSLSSSAATIQHGSSVTFTAQVSSSQSSSPPITGTVLFSSDSVAIGPAVSLTNGQAQITTSSLSGGFHSITAQYQGDSNYAVSVGSVSETVNLISTTTTLASSNPTITQGSNVTLTATVTPGQTGGPAMTGNVQFEDSSNGISLGSVNLSNGQAQLITSSLAVGTDQLIAKYSGDSNYAASTSSTLTETVNPKPTFTVTANPTTIAIASPGQSGSTTLTITGENGFRTNGGAALTATCSGLPAESTCSASPTTVSIATNGTATANLTVMTTAPSTAVPSSEDRWDIDSWSAPSAETALVLALTLLLIFGIVRALSGRQRRWGLVLGLAACALFFANAGCGGGGGAGGSSGPTNPGTPAGSYAVTVTVTTNNVTQTLPLTVSVQ